MDRKEQPLRHDPVDIVREHRLFLRREENVPHSSYAQEKLIHKVIRSGREDLIDMVLSLPMDGTSGILAREELRHRKNMLITAITLFTRAAMDGGLEEELAYAMSDSYIQYGENCSTEKAIDELYQRALREFTKAVFKKGRIKYSPEVLKAIKYIQVHLHDQIRLEDIAKETKMSKYYLCRKLKSELGLSFVEYVQRERVEASKHMLIYTDLKISVISEYYHFSSQSYYIKVFDKYMRMTPHAFRRNAN